MKTLKNLLIALIPVICGTGCKKNDPAPDPQAAAEAALLGAWNLSRVIETTTKSDGTKETKTYTSDVFPDQIAFEFLNNGVMYQVNKTTGKEDRASWSMDMVTAQGTGQYRANLILSLSSESPIPFDLMISTGSSPMALELSVNTAADKRQTFEFKKAL